MLLYEPPPTNADLHFRVFGFPVRVSPAFWIVSVLMGLGGTARPSDVIAWVAVVFVSILVHELGHAFAQRLYGGRPWITLHGLGGLASCNDCDRRPWSQIIISLAGPFAGFLLAAAMVVVLRVTGTVFGLAFDVESISVTTEGAPDWIELLGVWIYWEQLPSAIGNLLVRQMLWVNIGWGLVNLLPIYPLDGGRISREVLTLSNPRDGIVMSLWLSIMAATAMALIGIALWKEWYVAVMFGYLAYSNFTTLQAYQGQRW